ncbi:uncharacterized protein isoform X3 [Salmo salar]|uniref:Uncharacterized protein isoform X3 n=1 Tax=Salmo salar TaxID=8030 RepID=A0A1S3SRR6_SALSA|nr:uncharacterized protein LOC106611388 isoform X3 [Salmo salar]|eukprot:XP_014067035.1 PREDICTED: uncharacterized protein LOC106611388 isoform X2 [Salmo salar]
MMDGENKPSLLLFFTEPKSEGPDCNSGAQSEQQAPEMASVKQEDCSQTLGLNVNIKDEGRLESSKKRRKNRKSYYSKEKDLTTLNLRLKLKRPESNTMKKEKLRGLTTAHTVRRVSHSHHILKDTCGNILERSLIPALSVGSASERQLI